MCPKGHRLTELRPEWAQRYWCAGCGAVFKRVGQVFVKVVVGRNADVSTGV